MIVDDAAAEIGFSGGAAAKAGEATAKIGAKACTAATSIDDKAAEAIKRGSSSVDKGARALGKQIGKTRGMFSAFKDEFKKASSSSSTRKSRA